MTLRTPGTRLTWSTALEWIAAAERIETWRISVRTYRARRAHLYVLAWPALNSADVDTWFAAQPVEELLALEAFVKNERHHYRPPAGMRDGTPYVQVLNNINRAIARIRSGKL